MLPKAEPKDMLPLHFHRLTVQGPQPGLVNPVFLCRGKLLLSPSNCQLTCTGLLYKVELKFTCLGLCLSCSEIQAVKWGFAKNLLE